MDVTTRVLIIPRTLTIFQTRDVNLSKRSAAIPEKQPRTEEARRQTVRFCAQRTHL